VFALVPDLFPWLSLQVVTQYSDAQLPKVLDALERMSHHLTAAVVSNDVQFVQHLLAHTVNGTTYAGIRARTTGACVCGFLHPFASIAFERVQLVRACLLRGVRVAE
jgi:hypothetical protein